jgi:hypothetical protein
LISSLWEGLIFVAAIGLCLQLVPRTTAKLRFTVWAFAFVALAALPVLNVAFASRSHAVTPLSAAPHLQLDPRWSYALAGLWLTASISGFAYFVLQAIKLRSLWNSALPVSTELLPELSLGDVQLCISTEIDRPSVIGFFSPRILIPAWLFDQLTPGELYQIVLHEIEHLRRRDDWINLLQKIGLVLFPLNPALFWIDRRLATERELACDDGVLNRTRAPRAYATCLTSLAERRLEHCGHDRLTVLALGAVGAIRRSDFSRRIERILGWRSALNSASSRALASLLIFGVLGGAATLAHAPQLVSFTGGEQAQPVAAAMLSHQAVLTNKTATNHSARFEYAVFHAQPVAGNSPAPRRARLKAKLKPHSVDPAIQNDAFSIEAVQKQNPQRSLLTSWRQNAPQSVLLSLPDGRTFLATYAVGPNQAGWFIIQL